MTFGTNERTKECTRASASSRPQNVTTDAAPSLSLRSPPSSTSKS
jgi:hypothetical protein